MRTLIVEEKCRRCENITTYNYNSERQQDFYDLVKETKGRITNPKQSYCDICKKATVHEVVSYEENEAT